MSTVIFGFSNQINFCLFDCLFVCLFVWLVGWLVGWLAGWLVGLLGACNVPHTAKVAWRQSIAKNLTRQTKEARVRSRGPLLTNLFV